MREEKGKEKINHEHRYRNCIFIEEENALRVGIGKRCQICGKIEMVYLPKEKLKNGYSRILKVEEAIKKYPKFEKVYVKKINAMEF